jgi:hypothetical protein
MNNHNEIKIPCPKIYFHVYDEEMFITNRININI